jgi:predicted NBD/HSP70 family sugar kinase
MIQKNINNACLDNGMIIGVDIGGTSIKAGVVDNGKILKVERVKTPKDQDEFVFAVKNVVQYLLDEFPGKITGVGIGCPGPLDVDTGMILNPPSLPHKTDLGVLRKEFDVPIAFHNDANCFTLAEAAFGSGAGKEHVLGITLGTGFGAGLVVKGKLFVGRGNALEIAHTIMRTNEEEKFPHLVRGCVEQYISAGALLRLAAKYELDVDDPFKIYQIATMKNEKALAVFKEFGRDLGIALTNCIHSFDPDVIVVGGAVSQAWEFFEDAMLASVEEHCLHHHCVIVKSSVADAGIVGASLLVGNEEI